MENTTAGILPLTRVQPAPAPRHPTQLVVNGPPDRLSRLPKAAADKLSRFQAQQENALAIRQSVSHERNRVQQERGRVNQTITRLEVSHDTDTSAYAYARGEIERLDRELEQLAQRLAPLDDFKVNLGTIERAIDALPDPINLAPLPIIPDGATVDSIRAEIVQLKSELAKLRAEPLSANERRQKAWDWIAARATIPTVNVLGDVAVPAHAPIRTRLTDAFVTTGTMDRVDGFITQQGDDVLGILLGLFPDVALKAMTKDLPDGIDSEDRAMRVTDILAAILEAERVDVLLSEQNAQPYRPDTDARALLGVD